jgi:hypothetical protein
MATTTKGPADQVFDALGESSAALFDRVKAGNERATRVAAAVIKEAEWAQQGALDLGRKFAKRPADILGLAAAAYEKSVEAQDRAFAFVRQLLDEVTVSARETRTTIEKVARAQVSAGQPAVDAVRGIVDRTGELIRPAILRATGTQPPAPKPATRRAAQSEEAA